MPIMMSAQQLGRLLQVQRKKRSLTGAQLGIRVGLSQSKISKIEQGHPPALSLENLEKILDILDASQQIRQQAHLLMAQQNPDISAPSVYHLQHPADFYFKLEQKATSIYVYSHNILPALLQVPAYREASLQIMGLRQNEIQIIIKESLKRQDLLWNPETSHLIFIQEAALYTLPSTITTQLTQLDRVERLIGLRSCTVGILPTSAGLPVFELPNTIMYDEKRVLASYGLTDVEFQDAETVRQYISAFAELRQKAYFDDDARLLIRNAMDYFDGKQIDL